MTAVGLTAPWFLIIWVLGTDISLDVASYHDETACMEEADSINAATLLLQAICWPDERWKPDSPTTGAER